MDLTYQVECCKPNWAQKLLTFLLIVSYGGVWVDFFAYPTEIACVLLVFIILAQSHSKIVIPKAFWGLYFLIVSLCLLSAIVTGTSLSSYISFLYRPIIAILILGTFGFKPEQFKSSLASVLKFVCLLALFSFIIMPFVHDYLPLMTSSGGFPIKTFGFIVNIGPTYPPYLNLGLPIYRNQGIFTEPGLLGIVANIYLYILLFEYKLKIKQCWLPIVVVLTSLSTTGLLILGFQLAVWGVKAITVNKGSRIKSLFWVAVVSILLFPFIYSEVNAKFTREGGTGREYDTFMALEVAKSNPLIGIGPDKQRYMQETTKHSVVVNDQVRSEARGNSNGLLALVCWMGVPIAILFLYGLYKQNLFPGGRKIFMGILIMAFFGEPNILNDFVFVILVSSVIKRRKALVLVKS